MSDLSLDVTRTIPAPPERVFDAWLDPAMLAKFMIPGPDMTVPSASSDAKEGGNFEIVMRAGDQDMPHTGEYKEIDRPNRLVFTWNSPFASDEGTVTLTFTPEGDGTKVHLHHIVFPNEESRDNHEGGWGMILDALAEAV